MLDIKKKPVKFSDLDIETQKNANTINPVINQQAMKIITGDLVINVV